LTEGKHRKFVRELEQVTYNGAYARERGQTTLFVTERAVFQTGPQGLELIEIAPGIDLQRDVLAHMNFTPAISDNLREMDPRLFDERPMGLERELQGDWPVHERLLAYN